MNRSNPLTPFIQAMQSELATEEAWLGIYNSSDKIAVVSASFVLARKGRYHQYASINLRFQTTTRTS
jgi:hypothetical protein